MDVSGKPTLIQKDPQKGNTENNYRPKMFLPIMLKILTAKIKVDIYYLLILFTNPSARAGYDTRSIFK